MRNLSEMAVIIWYIKIIFLVSKQYSFNSLKNKQKKWATIVFNQLLLIEINKKFKK